MESIALTMPESVVTGRLIGYSSITWDWGRVARDPGIIRSRRFIACDRDPLQVLL